MNECCSSLVGEGRGGEGRGGNAPCDMVGTQCKVKLLHTTAESVSHRESFD